MPREFGRHRRMAKQIQHELAELLQRRLPVGEYGLVSVSDVDLSPDLKHARVFVSCFEKGLVDELMAGLNAASGELRHALAKRVRARGVPHLRFFHDCSIERAERIDALLAARRDHEGD